MPDEINMKTSLHAKKLEQTLGKKAKSYPYAVLALTPSNVFTAKV